MTVNETLTLILASNTVLIALIGLVVTIVVAINRNHKK